MTQNPKAFVSYTWESDEMKSWVKSLSTKLRSNGIDVKNLSMGTSPWRSNAAFYGEIS